jgi:hypothetical protein
MPSRPEIETTVADAARHQPNGRCLRKVSPNGAKRLDSEAFATLGTACVDHGTTTTGFHANQKAVGTGAASF